MLSKTHLLSLVLFTMSMSVFICISYEKCINTPARLSFIQFELHLL